MSAGGERERLIAVDHPEQGIVLPAWARRVPTFTRYDNTHELPLIIADAAGRTMARFADPADAAQFLDGYTIDTSRLTLPLEIVRQWNDAREARAMAATADLPAMLRNAGAQ